MNTAGKRISRSSQDTGTWCLRRLHLAGILLLTLMLTACQVEVHHDLTENQANIMLVTLLKHGIRAEKVSQGKTGYMLTVDESRLVQALEILKENNLPRQDYENLGNVFSGQGMISSPSEEQARMTYAIAQELSDTFSRIDGVLTSRVHVVLQTTDQATDTRIPPSAAVFLRHVPDSPVVNLIPKIREVTGKAVPGLDYERVSVMLVPVRESVSVPREFPPTFMAMLMDSASDRPSLVLGVGLALVAVLGGMLTLVLSFIRQYKKQKIQILDKGE